MALAEMKRQDSAAGKPSIQKSVTSWLKKGGQPDVFRTLQEASIELEDAQSELKRLRGILETLQRDYEESKSLDVFRRYGKLKNMIKRTCMHLKLANITNVSGLVPGTKGVGLSAMGGLFVGTKEGVKKLEQTRKREECFKNLSTEEATLELKKVEDRLRDVNRKVSLLRESINTLDRHYEASKQRFPVQRYALLKAIVKNILESGLLKDNT